MPIWSGQRPLAWAGPLQNMVAATRRHLSTTDKLQVLSRQKRVCNCCGEHIELHPVANCDADHIIPVMRGGKTVLENTQLLCVTCHRRKTLHESRNSTKTVDVPFKLAKEVYIFSTEDELQLPADKRTPLEAVSKGCGLSLLTYNKVKRTYVEHHAEYEKMLSAFAFRPALQHTGETRGTRLLPFG